MGILSNLFKPKPDKSKSESSEESRTFAVSAFSKRPRNPEALAGDTATDAPAATEESADAPQRNISLGNFKRKDASTSEVRETRKNITSTVAPAATPDIKAHARSIVPVKATAISDQQITIGIEDVLSQIPAQFLKTDPKAAAKKPLLFNSYELRPSLSQGKATFPLSRIAELAPEFFNGQTIPVDTQVELPLQKIVAQIGAFPGRPDQVEEIYPPLDSRYAKLVLQKGEAPPVTAEKQPSAEIAAPAKIAEAPVVPAATAPPVETATPVVEETLPAAEAPKIEPVTPPAQVIEVSAPAMDQKPITEEAGTNGSSENHAPAPEAEIETVSYSLASIFPNVPKSWIAGDLKSVDGAARIIVPFDLVEMQLATGKVELAFADFLQALPENLKNRFPGSKEEGAAAKVLIPLNEVFQNLPGVEPLPPIAKPIAPEPEEELEEAAPEAETKQPEPEVAPEEKVVVAKTEPISEPVAIEPEKPEPVAAEIRTAVVEEKPPVAEVSAATPAPANLQPEPQIAPESPKPIELPVAVEAPVAPVIPVEAVVAAPTLPVEAKVSAEVPTPAPVEVAKEQEAIQPPAVTPLAEPASASSKIEPPVEITPAAAVAEPEAPAPVPTPAPEPPKVAFVPPPVTAYVEPEERPFIPFVAPQIQVRRMAPPPLVAKESPAPVLAIPQPQPVEVKAPALVPEPAPVPVVAPAPAPVDEPIAQAEPAPASHPFVKDLIVTDGKLDTRKTVEHVILLPGVKAATLTIKGKAKTAGAIPEDFHVQDMGKAATLLFQALDTHAPKSPAGTTRTITLHHDQFSSTYFKQNGILLCVLHAQRSLEAEPHHAVLLVMQEIVRLRQH